jgi:BlaI family penicillinase repressor
MLRHPIRPTKAELTILTVLWRQGPSTVREVCDVLRRSKVSIEYSTTLKFMQIMAKKGLLLRDETKRAHVYWPAQAREVIQERLADNLLEGAFSGSIKDFLIVLLAVSGSKEDLVELRNSLNEYGMESK